LRCNAIWKVLGLFHFFGKKEKMQESCTTFVFVALDPMNRSCCWHTCERAGRGKKDPQEQEEERERERERDDVQQFSNF
jgi:hypothetical protein